MELHGHGGLLFVLGTEERERPGGVRERRRKEGKKRQGEKGAAVLGLQVAGDGARAREPHLLCHWLDKMNKGARAEFLEDAGVICKIESFSQIH